MWKSENKWVRPPPDKCDRRSYATQRQKRCRNELQRVHNEDLLHSSKEEHEKGGNKDDDGFINMGFNRDRHIQRETGSIEFRVEEIARNLHVN